MHDKSSFGKRCCNRGLAVSALASEMRRMVFGAAAPVAPGETIKAQQRRAWEALSKPPFWRLRAAWYGDAGKWTGTAIEDMRRRDAARRRKQEASRDQARELAFIYATAAERLRAIDANFHRDEITRLELAARAVGGVDRPVAGPDKE